VPQSLLRGDRLQAAREAMGLTREELASQHELSSPSRIRVWETGLERPRPRFMPRLAAALGVDPLYLLDVDPDDPPLVALRLAAGLATNEITAPGGGSRSPPPISWRRVRLPTLPWRLSRTSNGTLGMLFRPGTVTAESEDSPHFHGIRSDHRRSTTHSLGAVQGQRRCAAAGRRA
jgi:transcriptional regulator with XRE-family HTH domain